jgi:hypothetical protein
MTEEQKNINVGEELAKREKQPLEGERNTTALNSSQSRLMPGSRTLVALLLGVSILVGGVMAYKAYQTKNAPQTDAPPPTTVRNTLPLLTPNKDAVPVDSEASPPPSAPPVSDTAPSGMMDNPDSKEPSAEELLRQRRLTSNLIDEEGGQVQSAQASASSSSPQGGGEL